MDAFSSRLSKTMREKLEAESNDICRRMATAVAADFADYRERVGHVRGLKRALDILSEIENSLERAEDAGERAPIGVRRYED